MKESLEIEKMNELIIKLESAISKLNSKGLQVGDFINQETALKFLNYSPDKLRRLEREKLIVVSVYGHRKWYSVKSINDFLLKNIKK
jgi:hypothetical protein